MRQTDWRVERTEFVKWIIIEQAFGTLRAGDIRKYLRPDGGYDHGGIDWAWTGWKARALMKNRSHARKREKRRARTPSRNR